MPDENTPLPTVWAQLDERVRTNHERINEVRSIQIETVGRDGRNGKLKGLGDDVERNTGAIETNQKAIRAMTQKINTLTVKMAVVVGVAAIVGAVGAQLVLGG